MWRAFEPSKIWIFEVYTEQNAVKFCQQIETWGRLNFIFISKTWNWTQKIKKSGLGCVMNFKMFKKKLK